MQNTGRCQVHVYHCSVTCLSCPRGRQGGRTAQSDVWPIVDACTNENDILSCRALNRGKPTPNISRRTEWTDGRGRGV